MWIKFNYIVLLSVIIPSLLACNHRTQNTKTDQEETFDKLVQRFENTDRLKWQKPLEVIELLGDLKGKTVADIGAGTGYFTFRLATKAAKVLAIDIDERFIHFIENTKTTFPKLIQDRIETRLVNENDPKLKKEEVDAVLVVNTYKDIQDRISYFEKIRKENLKQNGRIMIVDYKKGNKLNLREEEIALSPTTVKKELREAGYKTIQINEGLLEHQYIIIAK